MSAVKSNLSNPLSELITNDTYELLLGQGLIGDRIIRNFQIRKKYKELRASKVSSGDAIEKIREDFPYLQFDTIRKIIYNIRK
ncbi:MAG: hypothetical protein ACM3Q2_16815 [Syntrophothermus sp.]